MGKMKKDGKVTFSELNKIHKEKKRIYYKLLRRKLSGDSTDETKVLLEGTEKDLKEAAKNINKCMFKTIKRIFKVGVVVGIIVLIYNFSTADERNAKQEAARIEKEKVQPIFEEIGYFKTTKGIPKVSRSFTIYTNSSSKKEMIEYAETKMYTERGFTLVHFFYNREKTPFIENVQEDRYDLGMFLIGATDYTPYMIGTFYKGMSGQEYWYNRDGITDLENSDRIPISKIKSN